MRNSSDRNDKGGCPNFKTDGCWNLLSANFVTLLMTVTKAGLQVAVPEKGGSRDPERVRKNLFGAESDSSHLFAKMDRKLL